MNIYFTGSITLKDQTQQKWYEKIVKILEGSGHNLNKENVNASKDTITSYTENEIMGTYKQIVKWIDNADVVIAELSRPSSGVGFEISYALNQRKPVLVVYNKELSPDQVSIPIRGNPSRYLTFEKCNNDNIEEVIKRFLSTAKDKLDTKFILIISPEIDRYLEWASDHKRMHKAQIVRNAVEKEMESDEDYKKVQEIAQKND